MINAVERLWQALALGAPDRAALELHENVVVERPHTGERVEGREAFLAAYADLPIEVHRVVTDGRHVATDVRAGTWAVASFFTIHDGRILRAVEYWVELP